MQNNFFSVVIPTFNRRHCISNSINSVINQRFKDFEIIVIDDASTDGTVEIIDEFIIRYSNIKYLRLSINSGTNIAKNEGARLSNGKYLVFLDSDDVLINIDSLSQIKTKLEEFEFPDLAMFSCIDFDGKSLSSNPSFEGILNFRSYFKGQIVGEYLPIVQSTTFNEFKFDHSMRGGEHLLWQKIVFKTNVILISSLVVRLYDNKGLDRMSHKNITQVNRILEVYKKDIVININSYLRYNISGMFLTFSKIMYYQVQICYVKLFGIKNRN
jgi:glycosyltransferase involved in cell wall biosynthesis